MALMARPAPTTVRGQLTRERVLRAAMQLIRERGVAAVSLDDVQTAAGVGRSQLYHYFDSRDDLIHAVIDTTVDAVLGGGADGPFIVDSLADIERWFAWAESICVSTGGVGGCPIGSLVSQLAEQDESARAALADAFARWEAPLLAGLARMRDRGEVEQSTAVAELADFVMATLQGGLLLAQVRRDPDQLRRALTGARRALGSVAAPVS